MNYSHAVLKCFCNLYSIICVCDSCLKYAKNSYIHHLCIFVHSYIIEILKIFYKNSEDVGMAQKVEKQERDVTQ